MVTRKPVPTGGGSGLAPKASSPPYPVTPISTDPPRMQDMRNELRSATDSDPDSASAWTEEASKKQDGGDSEHHNGPINLPDSLRIGPPGFTPKSSQEMLKPSATETNPFLQKHNAQSGLSNGGESSAEAWEGIPRPAHAPRHPPISKDTPPAEKFSQMSVSEPSTNPWQPALDEKIPAQPLPSLERIPEQDPWAAAPPLRPAPTMPQVSDPSQAPVLVDVDEPESPAWDEDEPSPAVSQMLLSNVQEKEQIDEDRHVWDQSQGHSMHQDAAVASELAQDPAQQSEGWNLVDHEPTQLHQQSGVIQADGIDVPSGEPGPTRAPRRSEEQGPELPPRRSQEQPPQPPRPMVDTAARSTSSFASPGTPATAARKQKKETYEIKKVTWHDFGSSQNPRTSPILVQNANGPCPLLALVNALTLSTPANAETALVETLRTREQVSLGLLLDAVFDELMSGRRGDAAHELPDVGDLYAFLITLHTGMNVNPRFVPPEPNKRMSNDPRNSMSHIHPTEREGAVPGTFEDTREMKLYSTFSIPLIHGWLPERDSPAYAALSRSAKSYEDAQNLMFHEEELEDKLSREGLSFEEQGTLEDIATIKAFFQTAATQLTPFGLVTITASLTPGSVAILFRNDHFSTLYRHPETLQLLQLVTDMGYAGHEEVVWESLMDVNGENAEFFSGDFRVVGGATHTSQADDNAGWTTVSGRGSRQNQTQKQSSASTSNTRFDVIQAPQSPNTEQEDHDLALALQLQEEEEERHRTEIARRQRETELSQQYIEQQGNSVPVSSRGGRGGRSGRGNRESSRGASELRPAIPPRRSGAGGQPVDPEAGVDVPPPSYAEAATESPYEPPANHPSHPNASPNQQRRTSAYGANSASFQGSALGGRNSRSNTMGRTPSFVHQVPHRRNSAGVTQQQDRERDCVVM